MVTNASGVPTGAVTVLNQGVWLNTLPSTGNLAAMASTSASLCTVNPTFAVSLGLVGIGFGNSYYGTGYGSGYPLTGITATVSGGGSPTIAPALGVPVVTPYVATLLSTIQSVQSATQVTLNTNASTAVNQAETVAFGTSDTAAIQAAYNAASLTKRGVYFPNSNGMYLSDQIIYPSGVQTNGPGVLMMAPASTNPLLNLGAGSNIEISQIGCVGNQATSLNPNSGSSCVSVSPGASSINVHNVAASGWTKHCLAFDGVAGLQVNDNIISSCYFGAGVLLSSTVVSSSVGANRNRISNTQLAGIQDYVVIDGGAVSQNIVTNGGNAGYGDSTGGNVADCITGYTTSASNDNTVLDGNILVGCGNNGLHWGGNNITVSNNTIISAQLYCVLMSAAPSTLPPETTNNKLIGNHCTGTDKTNSQKGGYSLRNVNGGSVIGNTATNVYMGLELYGFASSVGTRDIAVSGNFFTSTVFCLWLRKKAQYNSISGNVCESSTVGLAFDNSSLSIDTSGSFPSFYNAVGRNVWDGVTTQIQELAGNNETIDQQTVVNGAASNTIIGSATIMQPPLGPFAVGSLPSAVTYKYTCIVITGSTTGFINACSNGTSWIWSNGVTVTTMIDPANENGSLTMTA